jgi:hypothetical protein
MAEMAWEVRAMVEDGEDENDEGEDLRKRMS